MVADAGGGNSAQHNSIAGQIHELITQRQKLLAEQYTRCGRTAIVGMTASVVLIVISVLSFRQEPLVGDNSLAILLLVSGTATELVFAALLFWLARSASRNRQSEHAANELESAWISLALAGEIAEERRDAVLSSIAYELSHRLIGANARERPATYR